MSSRAASVPLALALFLAAPAWSEPVPPDVYCGDGYWFEIEEPPQWKGDWLPGGEMLTLTFQPPDATAGAEGARMSLTLMFSSSPHRRDVRIDVEEVLERWVQLLNVRFVPRDIRTFRAPHPHLPTAGVELVADGGNAYVVAIDVLSGRGDYFIALFARPDGATQDDLELFRATIASIDFDPRRACTGNGAGELEVVHLPGPDTEAARPLPAAPREARQAFDLEAAASGCTMLYQLFVPLYCRMVKIADQPALLAFFDDDDGSERAAVYLERFRDRVAVPFCYEARRHPEGAPTLVFHAETAPLARAYDCGAKDYGRSVPLSEIGEPERGSAE